ncbi:MAG TPA: hypothetical protein VEJ39_08970 [Candidatus Acidoferrales bacterium]|nr:hypothetical protein [Candidatus Acidoferrales bacterium]
MGRHHKDRGFARLTGWLCLPVLAAAVVLIPQASPQSQAPPSQNQTDSKSDAYLARGKKLYLKDGTFHLVREYKLDGDRVRYYSVERSAWEEVPSDLVDWDATHKAEVAQAQENAALVAKVHNDDEVARNAVMVDVDASVEIAPGTFLPEGEGLFLLDHSDVKLLKQADTDITFDKGQVLKQVLIPIPIVPTRHTVSLPGTRAKLRLTNNQPEFYRRRPDGHEPEIYLIPATVRNGKRQIEKIDTLFDMEVAKRNSISIEKWELVKGVYRISLSQPLSPGEYAFAEVAKPDDQALYVWDFGVDVVPSKK